MEQERRRILLVEDNPADVRLTQEVLRESKMEVTLDVVRDGEQAIAFLRQQGEYSNAARPDLVLLDLNLPRKDGREVLADVKSDPLLQSIPIVMLTTSKAEHDVADCYARHVNSYIIKPVDLDEFVEVMETVERFWLKTVRLPSAH